MDYVEVVFQVDPPNPWVDILINYLAEIGYESFEETENGCKAYIPADHFDDNKLKSIDLGKIFNQRVKFSFNHHKVKNINWNEKWEKDYKPVLIKEKCYIRAPFHSPKPDSELEIIIEPKMSFGTGHHKTTVLMVEYLMEEDFKNKSVLDMGCGTGVLAIISKKLGAETVTAIDNHQFAYENTIENATINDTDIKVLHGDSNILGDECYDIIIANINKNVLLSDMKKYTDVLNFQGNIFLSGFLKEDCKDIENKARELELTFEDKKISEGWVALKMIKNKNY